MVVYARLNFTSIIDVCGSKLECYLTESLHHLLLVSKPFLTCTVLVTLVHFGNAPISGHLRLGKLRTVDLMLPPEKAHVNFIWRQRLITRIYQSCLVVYPPSAQATEGIYKERILTVTSYSLCTNCTTVVLPPPLLPTKATFSPGSIERLRSRRTWSVNMAYVLLAVDELQQTLENAVTFVKLQQDTY